MAILAALLIFMLLRQKCHNSYHRDVTLELFKIYPTTSETVFRQMLASVGCRNPERKETDKYAAFIKDKIQKLFPFPIGEPAHKCFYERPNRHSPEVDKSIDILADPKVPI